MSARRKNSRAKGKRGEIEAVKFLANWFGSAKRGLAQTRSGSDAPDVNGVEGFWIEVKRRHQVAIEAFLLQAEQAKIEAVSKGVAQSSAVPIVLIRRDRGRWRVYLDAEEFFGLVSPPR